MSRDRDVEEFEERYAARSGDGLSVRYLHAAGRLGWWCDCGDETCEGFQMLHADGMVDLLLQYRKLGTPDELARAVSITRAAEELLSAEVHALGEDAWHERYQVLWDLIVPSAGEILDALGERLSAGLSGAADTTKGETGA